MIRDAEEKMHSYRLFHGMTKSSITDAVVSALNECTRLKYRNTISRLHLRSGLWKHIVVDC